LEKDLCTIRPLPTKAQEAEGEEAVEVRAAMPGNTVEARIIGTTRVRTTAKQTRIKLF